MNGKKKLCFVKTNEDKEEYKKSARKKFLLSNTNEPVLRLLPTRLLF